jgi:predicted RNA-binding protein with PIN domain
VLTYIIDAYNVIHRDPLFRVRAKKDIAGAREHLIALTSGFAIRGKKKVIIVFDGTGRDEEGNPSGVQIIYSEPGKNADIRIKELIAKSKNPRNLVIISSDSEVARYGKLYACRIMLADKFMGELSRGKDRPVDEKPSSMSKQEQEEWLRLFGEGRRNRPPLK